MTLSNDTSAAEPSDVQAHGPDHQTQDQAGAPEGPSASLVAQETTSGQHLQTSGGNAAGRQWPRLQMMQQQQQQPLQQTRGSSQPFPGNQAEATIPAARSDGRDRPCQPAGVYQTRRPQLPTSACMPDEHQSDAGSSQQQMHPRLPTAADAPVQGHAQLRDDSQQAAAYPPQLPMNGWSIMHQGRPYFIPFEPGFAPGYGFISPYGASTRGAVQPPSSVGHILGYPSPMQAQQSYAGHGHLQQLQQQLQQEQWQCLQHANQSGTTIARASNAGPGLGKDFGASSRQRPLTHSAPSANYAGPSWHNGSFAGNGRGYSTSAAAQQAFLRHQRSFSYDNAASRGPGGSLLPSARASPFHSAMGPVQSNSSGPAPLWGNEPRGLSSQYDDPRDRASIADGGAPGDAMDLSPDLDLDFSSLSSARSTASSAAAHSTLGKPYGNGLQTSGSSGFDTVQRPAKPGSSKGPAATQGMQRRADLTSSGSLPRDGPDGQAVRMHQQPGLASQTPAAMGPSATGPSWSEGHEPKAPLHSAWQQVWWSRKHQFPAS